MSTVYIILCIYHSLLTLTVLAVLSAPQLDLDTVICEVPWMGSSKFSSSSFRADPWKKLEFHSQVHAGAGKH